ncbi:peptide-n4-(n-acetyl-beta-glucosaminyl) asparagine amidase a [Phtheirospermum japonicum]|uniref:Peptide-n4-(N-acetyl-beta-glucosaminyl) asparagine amidase a n=1 Tax=Phtheirospermum japonicum TaxID=374723 RepID=A0A830CI47_9LAMI|nr:peptide-n4-(n-acetyl-beta-glucosaminyl) asparagine amidase a [Phtheirospermum japonicum]
MHPSLIFLSLTLLLPLAAALPPPHLTRHRLNRRRSSAAPPQEHIEVTRPLPIESLPLSCKLPILSHTFGNTIDLPPTNDTYSPPSNCSWTHAVLHLSGASNGSQYDRIAGVWLAGAEILRTSTPEPTDDGISWNVRKDVTKYSSLLRQSNLTLSVMLENIVNDVYTAVYQVNLTLYFYNNASSDAPKSTNTSLNMNSSLELNKNPADLIIPLSASGEEGFWFKIEKELDAVYHGIQIPLNTYRAVIEVYVSFHGNDEFWYSNPPDSYIEMNNLTTQRGHGAYREVLVKLENNVIGSVMPFPVIFTGGINPLFWEPIVSIGAFDLPSYEIELTPFLGMLLDGKVHYFGLSVADAIPFWLVDANLHLWLDDKIDMVQAGPIKYSVPSTCVERKFKFNQLAGEFEIEGERESELSGWVFSSAGNFTTHVTNKLEFENTIEFKNNGTEKSVEHEVEIKNKVQIKSDTGYTVSSLTVEKKYPLEFTTTTLPGSGVNDNYLVTTKLEQSLKEEKKELGTGNVEVKSTLESKQKSSGWMFVQDHDVLSGSASTEQRYKVEDVFGCYTRRVVAEAGVITTDTENFICATAPASSFTMFDRK